MCMESAQTLKEGDPSCLRQVDFEYEAWLEVANQLYKCSELHGGGLEAVVGEGAYTFSLLVA